MDAEIAGLEAKHAWEVFERSSMPANMKAIPGNMGPENKTETFRRAEQIQESLGLPRRLATDGRH